MRPLEALAAGIIDGVRLEDLPGRCLVWDIAKQWACRYSVKSNEFKG